MGKDRTGSVAAGASAWAQVCVFRMTLVGDLTSPRSLHPHSNAATTSAWGAPTRLA